MRRGLMIGLSVAAIGALLVGAAWAWTNRQGGTAGGWLSGWNDPARALAAQVTRAEAKGQWPQAVELGERVLHDYPHAAHLDHALLALGSAYAHQDRLVEARTAYQRLMNELTNSPLVGEAQERLGDINIRLLFSPIVTAQDASYEVQPGDSLTKIARQFRTTVELLNRANHLTGDTIRPRMHLKIPKTSFSVVVNKSQNTLTLKNAEEVWKVYRVATGKDNSTPVGTFHITSRIPNPPWYTPQGVIPFGDPRNILGTHWLGFDKPGYGLHGTADPSSIGKQATAGCVRLANTDVEELYTLLPLDTQVMIID